MPGLTTGLKFFAALTVARFQVALLNIALRRAENQAVPSSISNSEQMLCVMERQAGHGQSHFRDMSCYPKIFDCELQHFGNMRDVDFFVWV